MRTGTGACAGVALLREAVIAAVHANLVVAMAAVGVAVTSARVFGETLAAEAALGVFAAAYMAYTLNRFLDREEDRENVPDRSDFIHRHGAWMLRIGVLGLLGALALGLALAPGMVPLILLPIGVAWVYSRYGKHVLLVKNLIVGLAWGLIPLGVALYGRGPIDATSVVAAGFVLVFLTVAAAIFDIKDRPGDRAAGVRTLPTTIGVRRTRALAIGVLLLCLPGIVGATVLTERFLVLLGYPAYLLATTPFATAERGPLYYGIAIDGEHLAVAGLAVWAL